MKKTTADRQERKVGTNLRQTILFGILSVGMTVLFASALIFLNVSNSDYERLAAERQAGLAAAAVWEWLRQSVENDRSLPPDFVDIQANTSEILKSVKGLLLVSQRGQIVGRIGDVPAGMTDIRHYLSRARNLPFGDRAIEQDDNTLLYIRDTMPRLRPMGMMPNVLAQRFIVLFYDTSEIRAEGELRRILLYALSIASFLLLAVTGLMYVRWKKARDDAARQDSLARLGMAARTLAHEIRNPLSVIVMQKSLLRRRLGKEFEPELARIEKESDRIAGLARRVKTLMDKPDGNPRPLNPYEHIGTIVTEQDSWHDKVTVKSEPDLCVLIDPEHLRTIVVNLVENALFAQAHRGSEKPDISQTLPDSGPEHEPVRIALQVVSHTTVRTGGYRLLHEIGDKLRRFPRLFADRKKPLPKTTRYRRMVSITVSDKGGGVPPESEPLIFDPFFTTKTEGSGVGLSLSLHLAQAADGDIVYARRLYSDGIGADFTVFLPFYEGKESKA